MVGLSLEEEIRRLKVLKTATGMPDDEYERRVEMLKRRFAASAPQIPATPARAAAPPAQRGADIPPGERPAPYCFVDLNAVIVPPPKAIGTAADVHSVPLENGYCATINVCFEAETPLLIGMEKDGISVPLAAGNGTLTDTAVLSLKDGISVPLAAGNPDTGPWWIPGASLRGMLRAAAEIVGYGRLEQTNAHYVFSLRDFEHPAYNDTRGVKGGFALGKADQVKAGWLNKTGEGEDARHFITEATLSYVEIDDILASAVSNPRDRDSWNRLELGMKYSALGMMAQGKPDFGKTASFSAAPAGAQGQKMVRPDRNGGVKGVWVVSNKTPPQDEKRRKRFEYVFSPFDARAPRHEISKDAFRRFELVHTKPGRKIERDPDGSWKIVKPWLEKSGGPIPVFYVGKPEHPQGRDFAFGLTRLFKIPHKATQGEMIALSKGHGRGTGPYELDMVGALFGYVDEPEDKQVESTALKGRVAVSGALIEEANVTEQLETVMGAPSASFAPYYLKGDVKDWSAGPDLGGEDTRIAGRKRYLPRHRSGDALAAIRKRFTDQVEGLSEKARDNVDTKTRLRALVATGSAPLRFDFQIRLHNVLASEIGLVMFALTFDRRPDCRHMLGRGKPFGMGQIRLAEAALKGKPNFTDQPALTGEHCRAEFVAHMKQQGIAHFPETDVIREFFGAALPANGAQMPEAPLYLGLKDHRKLRQQAGALANNRKPIRGPKRLLAAPRP